MFRDDSLRYFIYYVVPTVSNIDDSFRKLQEHFVTPAHRGTYTTEWNTLSFSDIRQKNPGKETSQIVDLLFLRARDIQTLLDEPYNSPLLLRDCVIRTVKNQPFYTLLITSTIPADRKTLHTNLHQCKRQQETSKPKANPSSSGDLYLADQEEADNDEELELHYSNSGSPFFKRRVMSGSSSFSIPDYRLSQRNYRGRGHRRSIRHGNFRPTRKVSFAPVKNPTDSTGRALLCSFCNSWFHSFRDCPDRNNSTLHYGEIDEAEKTEHAKPEGAPPPPDTFQMDRSIDEYNFNTDNITVPAANIDDDGPKLDIFFLTLAYNMEQEFNNSYHEHYHHNKPNLSPNVDHVRTLYPDLHYDMRATYYGICFDEGAPHSVTGFNQWMAYLRTYHTPALRRIENHQSSIIFGGKGKNKVRVRTIGIVTIRVPLPANCCFNYRSFLISNDVPRLLGLSTQIKLKTVTDKNPINPTATFKTVGVTIQLTRKFGHPYPEGPPPHEFLFSMAELAQVHRNLGHAPA